MTHSFPTRRSSDLGLFHPGGQYPLAAAGRGDDPVRSVLSRMAAVPGGGRRMRLARPTVRGVSRRHPAAAGAGGAHPVESRAPSDRIMPLPAGNAGRQFGTAVAPLPLRQRTTENGTDTV